MLKPSMTLDCVTDWVLKDLFLTDEARDLAFKNWRLDEPNKYVRVFNLKALVTEMEINNETSYLEDEQGLDTYLMEHLNMLAIKKELWNHPISEGDERDNFENPMKGDWAEDEYRV